MRVLCIVAGMSVCRVRLISIRGGAASQPAQLNSPQVGTNATAAAALAALQASAGAFYSPLVSGLLMEAQVQCALPKK